MKRRDFLLGAAALLLFPSDAFANTVVRQERTFGRKKPELIVKDTGNAPEVRYEGKYNFSGEMPEIIETNLISPNANISHRRATNRIIIHHTGNRTDADMSAAQAHDVHRRDFGWAGIGYHYVIRKDGTIERGRPEELVGAHSLNNNSDSIGIALSGNFYLGDPTEYQMESLVALSAYLSNKYGFHLPDYGALIGHRDTNKTGCPGDNLYYKLDSVRRFSV